MFKLISLVLSTDNIRHITITIIIIMYMIVLLIVSYEIHLSLPGGVLFINK